MIRIAIAGGGISGLAAAFELEQARRQGAPLEWQLYESTGRFGGIIDTIERDGFILEGGPDGWVSEKPWARDLAIDLGLEADLVFSNDAARKTWILLPESGTAGQLQAIPDRMRMMVPEDLSALEHSALFSVEARAAYANELTRAAELKANAPTTDESIATFVLRHFGQEVLTKIAAPLLSGVFGGDVAKLSVRAIMPQFAAMEREHGSLIAALQSKARNGASQPIFTSLRRGLGQLTGALIARLPPDRLHLHTAIREIAKSRTGWLTSLAKTDTTNIATRFSYFDHVLLATPVDATRKLLRPLDPTAAKLLPTEASSAILAALAWPAETAGAFTIPAGFGFLVPQTCNPGPSGPLALNPEPSLLAATFVDQKFPHRAPTNARILRAFFGGETADALASQPDHHIATAALAQLQQILGPLPTPDPTLTTVRRWPRSLPQYEVGHLDRIASLTQRMEAIPNLRLLGNSYRGVGLPDLIRDARASVRSFIDANFYTS